MFKPKDTLCLVAALMVTQLFVACDPADVREFTMPVGGGEQQIQSWVSEFDSIALRYGFHPDENNGTLRPEGIVAAWRKKLHPNDQTTRIACFVYFDRVTNTGRVRLVLFPGTELPPDTLSMLNELKTFLEKRGVSVQPVSPKR